MAVNFNTFVKWIKQNFSSDNYIIKGTEVRLNSIYDTDTNHHLWCSPSGGKKQYKDGVFHCFKTDKKGSLVRLVMDVENCDYDTAIARLKGESSMRELEAELKKMLEQEDYSFVTKPPVPQLELPPSCYLISDLSCSNWWRKRCEEYLLSRKIPIDGYYICTDGDFKNRIIIPYYDATGKLIYFNGRTLGKSKLRYRGPDKACGTGKSDVVYFPGRWPHPGEKVYLCEGEFNSKSLEIAELLSGACGGKNMGTNQILILKDFKICICLDRDKAGRVGLTNMTNLINSMGQHEFSYVLPPVGYNDWNEMLVKVGKEVLNIYIRGNEQRLARGPGGFADFFDV